MYTYSIFICFNVLDEAHILTHGSGKHTSYLPIKKRVKQVSKK